MCSPKVSKGRSESPLVAPAGAKSPAYGERPAIRSRPSGATQHGWSKEQLGGASEDARSYWQGRFAACAFVGGFLGIGRPRNGWGVAPNPSRDAVPAPCKGHCPLTRFLAARLERFTNLSFPQHYSKFFSPSQPLAEAPCDIILRPLIPRHREQLIRRPDFHHVP